MYGKLNVMRRIGTVAAVALAVSLLMPAGAHAAFKKVKVSAEGYSPRNAINNALRKAVEEAGGVKITSMSKMQNYQLIMDTVVATSTGVVKNYNVIKEPLAECVNNCSVTLEAEVSDQNLYDSVEAARLLFEQKGRPSILVMVTEQNAGAQTPEQWWANDNKSIDLGIVENDLIKRWKEYGFRFVDRQALTGKFRVTNPTSVEVKEVAADAGADIVIMGKAIATQSDGRGSGATPQFGDVVREVGMTPVKATVALRLLYVDTGEIISTAVADGNNFNVNASVAGRRALSHALSKASTEMFKGIMMRWQAEASGPQRLEVTANGFKKSGDFRRFMKTIQSKIEAVKDVNQRGYKKGSAKFEVMFLGSAFDFAEALESQQFPGFGIELEEVTGNTLTFSVTK